MKKSNSCRVTISHGNIKMGMSIPSVSLPAICTCVANAPCKKACYDARSYKRWPSVLKARLNNLNILKEDRSEYFLQINEFLNRNKPTYFRWHVGGDIVDQEYLHCMDAVAHTHPKVNFLCFTKRHELDFTKCPSNLTIILSMWPKWGQEDTHQGMRRAWM